MTKTTKAAKVTTKTASAKKFAPITITTTVNDCDVWPFLNELPAKVLIELLRERGIAICKRKGDMVTRLQLWLDDKNEPVTVTIR